MSGIVATVIGGVILTFIVLNILKDSVNGGGIFILYSFVFGGAILAVLAKTIVGTAFFVAVSFTALVMSFYWMAKVTLK